MHRYIILSTTFCIVGIFLLMTLLLPLIFIHAASATTSSTSSTEIKNVPTNTSAQPEVSPNPVAPTPDSATKKLTERRGQFSEAAKNRMKNLLSNVKSRMSASLERFIQISDRLDSRSE